MQSIILKTMNFVTQNTFSNSQSLGLRVFKMFNILHKFNRKLWLTVNYFRFSYCKINGPRKK
jgi:hypothetical protein